MKKFLIILWLECIFLNFMNDPNQNDASYFEDSKATKLLATTDDPNYIHNKAMTWHENELYQSYWKKYVFEIDKITFKIQKMYYQNKFFCEKDSNGDFRWGTDRGHIDHYENSYVTPEFQPENWYDYNLKSGRFSVEDMNCNSDDDLGLESL